MISTDQAQRLLTGGGNVVDPQGDAIGTVGQVFLDDQTGQPEWVTTQTGILDGSESFVPLRDAELTGTDVSVPFDKDKVNGAPRITDADGHLTPAEEDELYAYYGVSTGYDSAGHDTPGAETDDAMTRSEERVQVGTTQRETGRARLRKYVVTEQETFTVPVRKERAVLETEPVTEANRGDALAGGDLTSEEHEVVLSEEQVVVGRTTEPVERVRLGTITETGEETVTEEVRKERIEAEGDVSARDDHRS